MSRFRAGLDLGRESDYSALTIVEATRPQDANGLPSKQTKPTYLVRWAARWRRRSYVSIVDEVARTLSNAVLAADISLTFDATGVGKAVSDLLKQARSEGRLPCAPLAVTISSGRLVDEQVHPTGITVSKADLISNLEVALSQGRLPKSCGLGASTAR